MLQEARARMADVETGDEPSAMRPLEEEAPPPEPRVSAVRKARAGKRPSSRPAGEAEQPVVPSQPVPRPEPARSSSSADTLGADDLLWLEDPSGDTLGEPGEGSTEPATWRRGLRG
jgi:hypothetical protein